MMQEIIDEINKLEYDFTDWAPSVKKLFIADLLTILKNKTPAGAIERGDWVRGNHDDTWHESNETKSVYRSIIDAILYPLNRREPQHGE